MLCGVAGFVDQLNTNGNTSVWVVSQYDRHSGDEIYTEREGEGRGGEGRGGEVEEKGDILLSCLQQQGPGDSRLS